ncbi:methyltransferase [Desulfurococcaceae archaeon MEX13E-LK6-19]|nr:methyltransferase [Desulfurococcaceae archaeon MEX13E-LK6-19]
MKIAFTVNPGIEDIVAEEARAELGGKPVYNMLSGYVFLEEPKQGIEGIYRLRTINRAMILLTVIDNIRPDYSYLPELKAILEKNLGNIVEYVTPETSFAVQVERMGRHEYTSMDIARIVGDVVISITTKFYGRRPPVNLRNPNIIVHVFLREERLLAGIVLTGPWSMHRRGYRVYDHPAALKPTLAAAMLYISGTRDKQVIVDPMCGGGTIPIEAALLHEDAVIIGTDINPVHIKGARYNAVAAGVAGKTTFKVWDARRIHELLSNIDHMILNPPYGIRYGDPWSIRRLYRKFLESAWKALNDGGRLTMITTEFSYVHRIAEEIGYKIVHERTVFHGNLYPHIMVLEKSR